MVQESDRYVSIYSVLRVTEAFRAVSEDAVCFIVGMLADTRVVLDKIDYFHFRLNSGKRTGTTHISVVRLIQYRNMDI